MTNSSPFIESVARAQAREEMRALRRLTRVQFLLFVAQCIIIGLLVADRI